MPARLPLDSRTWSTVTRLGATAVAGALTVATLVGATPAEAAVPGLVSGAVLVSGFGVSTVGADGTLASYRSASGTAVAVDGFGNVYSVNTNVPDSVSPPADPTLPWAPPTSTHQEITLYPADGSSAVVIARSPSIRGSSFSNTGIAVDALGNVYWSDSGNGTVWKVAAGNRALTAVATGFRGIAGVTVDRSGNVYICEYAQNRLWRSTGYGTGAAAVIATNIGGAQGITTDTAGNIYLAEQQNKSIVRIAPNGVQTTVVTGLNSPDSGLDLDLTGNLVVVDSRSGANRVLSVPAAGGPVTVLATSPNFLYGVAVYKPSAAAFTAANPPGGSYNTAYRYAFATGAAAGTTTFAVASGTLPPGLTLDTASGVLSGVPTRAGSFGFAVSGTTAGVTATTPPVTVQIAPAPLTATVTGHRAYGGAASFAVTALNGFVNGDDADAVTGNPTCRTVPTASTGVGSYTGTLSNCSGLQASDYAISYVDGGFTVTPATATATVIGTQAYGGTPTFTVARVIDAAGIPLPWTGVLTGCAGTTSPSTPVGTPTSVDITGCSGIDAGPNYAVRYADGGTGTTPAPLRVTVTAAQVYGSAPSFTWAPVAADLRNGDTGSVVTGTLTGCATGTTATTPAGGIGQVLTAACMGLTSSNYAISYIAGNGFTVAKAPVTVTVSGAATYAGTPTWSVARYDGLVNGESGPDVVTGVPVCTTSASTTVVGGPVVKTIDPASCSGLSAADYTVTYADGGFTVAPAALTVTVDGTRTYGGATTDYSTTVTGLVNHDTRAVVTGTLAGCATDATAATPVGTAGNVLVAGCTGLVAANYTLAYRAGSVTTTPAPLTVPVAGTSTYGTTQKTFTTAPAAAWSGLLNGDDASAVTGTPTCPTAVTSSTAAGTSRAVIDTAHCSGLTAANYTVSYADAGFTVNPASLTATVNATRVYGSSATAYVTMFSPFAGQDTATAVTGTPTCSGGPASGAGVGRYTLPGATCSGLTSRNYAISYADGAAAVTPAPLTVVAPSASSTFGTAPTIPTATYTGWVNGDGASALTTPATCTTTATAASPAGTYPVTCTGASAANYTVDAGPAGTLTVTPATVTATYTGPASVSTASSLALSATLAGANPCLVGQTVTFALDSNPKTGVAGAFALGAATTNAAGIATAPAVSTTGWTAGARTVSVTTAGTGSCLPATTSTPLGITSPGAALLGAGSYTSPAGATSFAAAALRTGGPSGGYVGGMSVVVAGKWWFTGTVATFVKSSATQGVVTGSGTLSSWSTAANRGRGGWVVTQAVTRITMTVNCATKTAPAAVGVQIAYLPPTGSAPLPNSAPAALRSGVLLLA